MQPTTHFGIVDSKLIKAAVVVIALSLLTATSVFAGSATWDPDPTSGDWNTAANWTPMTVPNGATDTATFGISSTQELFLSADVDVDSIVFDPGASAYNINTGDTATFSVTGAGIINNSGLKQHFAVGSGLSSYGTMVFRQSADAGTATTFTTAGGPYSPAVIVFVDSATAGTGNFTNMGGPDSFQSGGYLQFSDSSSADNAVLINEGGSIENAGGGQLNFVDDATAGKAMITNDAGPANTTGNTSGGSTGFSGGATAGNATIVNEGSSINGGTAGATFFGGGGSGSADAADATLIANGGANGGAGGQIVFMSPSSGGRSRIELFGNGTLDFRSESELTVGSIEGDGLVLPGPTLIVGSNDLSTEFSGVINGFGALTKIGGGTLVLSGTNTYNGLTTINAGKMVVDGSIASDVTINSGGTLAGGGTVNSVTAASGGRVAPGDPRILTVNGNYQQESNSTLALVINGTGLTEFDQLMVGGNVTLADGSILELDFANRFAPQTGDTFNFLTFGSLTGSFATVNIVGLADGFQYTVTDDGNGHLQLKALNDGAATSTAKKLLNISTRLDVGTGDKVLIGGFIVTGSSPKKVLLRGIGPSLELAGLTGVLADPILELHEPGGMVLTNNDWRDTQEQEIIETGLAPLNDLESAIVATLDPGSYTAILGGAGNGTGVGLVEAYDIDQTADSELANVSTRGFVQTGDSVMIGGVILGGDAVQDSEVIVRAIGPSLANAGVIDPLEDPTIELHDQNGVLIAANDNWKDSQQLEIEAANLAPSDDRESAIAVTLAPDAYTAIVRGNNNSTGIALVEVYRLQQ